MSLIGKYIRWIEYDLNIEIELMVSKYPDITRAVRDVELHGLVLDKAMVRIRRIDKYTKNFVDTIEDAYIVDLGKNIIRAVPCRSIIGIKEEQKSDDFRNAGRITPSQKGLYEVQTFKISPTGIFEVCKMQFAMYDPIMSTWHLWDYDSEDYSVECEPSRWREVSRRN